MYGLDWTGLHKLDHQERYRKRKRKNEREKERERERTRKRKKETMRREQTMHSEVPCAIRINTPWFKERE
jgi:hypothetical protein